MRIMTKILTVLMIAVLALSAAGCGSAGKSGKGRKTSPGNKIDIEELQKNSGNMLVITRNPQEAMTAEQYEMARFEITITYEGNITIPGNPVNQTSLKLKNEDYIKIYKFGIDNAEKSKFANYKEDVCDGDTYTFTFYDTDGNPHVIYDGYCYNNKDLQDILNITGNYYID